jgi:hypothetical protein
MGLNAVGTVKDTSVLVLKHPNPAVKGPIPGPNGQPLSVTLWGPYSEPYRAAMRAQQQSRIESMTEGEQAPVLSYDEIEASMEELAIACVMDWNISFEGDEVLPLTRENIEAVFRAHPWVRDQVVGKVGNVGDFIEPPKQP